MALTIRKVVPRTQRMRIASKIREEQLRREDPEFAAKNPQLLPPSKEAPGEDADFSPQTAALLDSIPDPVGKLKRARDLLLKSGKPLRNLKPLLPILFNLNGKPYHIQNHFPFEPFYHVRLCRHMVWKTGRQCGKSSSQAANGILVSLLESYFNTLFVTPLFEMIRRFSANYVGPFISHSPIRALMVDSRCVNSVLQRSFRNQSILYFSFAFLNVDRTRGLNVARVSYDEVQDFDPSFLPLIAETTSGHPWGGVFQYTGTPKTKSNTLHQLFLNSSQAEFTVLCKACHYFNVPHIDHDLDAMLGPEFVNREISEESPGLVCAKCGRPLNPRHGRWEHLFPERRWTYSGYHVPQCIMPMHYADEEKWGVLLGKRAGFANTTPVMFYNEVCGEAYDTGAALITETDLRRAAVLPWENDLKAALEHFQPGNYVRRVLGVDWGGGGDKMVSLTSVAVLGQRPAGKIDVIYGWRSRSPHAHLVEAKYILQLMHAFRCSHLVHDMQGAGSSRETIIKMAGLPEALIVPIAYVRLGVGPMMKWVPYNENNGQRSHHRLDKARSLVNTCQLIKYGHIRFFQYDYKGPDRPGLMNDFLSLTEDFVASRTAAETFTVIRDEKAGPDDFAHAVNYGACALFHMAGRWPDIAELVKIKVSPQMLAEIKLPDDFDWGV